MSREFPASLRYRGNEYAVRVERPDEVLLTACASRFEAEALAGKTSGQVMVRAVYFTAWEAA